MKVYILVGIETERISPVIPFDSFEKVKEYCTEHFSLNKNDWCDLSDPSEESLYGYFGYIEPIDNGPNRPNTRYDRFWVFVREVK